MPFFKLLSQSIADMYCEIYFSGRVCNWRKERDLVIAVCHIFTVFLLSSPLSDSQRGSHDGSERSRGRVHIWRCQICVDRSPELCHASESEQLSLPWAQAHRVCRLTGVSETGVGDAAQFSKGLHFTREYDKFPISNILTFWGNALEKINTSCPLEMTNMQPKTFFGK